MIELKLNNEIEKIKFFLKKKKFKLNQLKKTY